MAGWIKIYRDIQEHWIWQDSTKLKWWLDIILMANHKENKFLLGNELFKVERGEFHTSEVKLAERWGVDRKTVRRFLELLEQDKMVDIKKSKKGTTIKVSNYNAFQDVFDNSMDNQRDNRGDNKVPTQGTDKSQISPNKGDTNKNEEECKKNEEECKKNEEECKKDDMVSRISLHYEKCFRKLVTPIHIEKLISFINDGMELELVMYIMEYASTKKEPYPYALKVLNNSLNNRIYTIRDFEIKSNEKINPEYDDQVKKPYIPF